MIKIKDDGAVGSAVYVVTNEDSAWICPSCGVFATRLKDYRTTRPRHLPCGGRPVSVRWRKARWHCTEPACPHGSFTEAVGTVPAGMRTTTALRRAAGAAVCDGGRTVVQAGRGLHMSWPIVQRCFQDYAAQILPETPPATEAIGIDETRRGKPVWKQNPDTGTWELLADAWHIGFVDAVGGRSLFGQVAGRNPTSVAGWLSSQPASWREQVRYAAIDLCSAFRAAVHRALPHAAVVVDCFHVVQLAQRHFADLRRRLTWKQHGRRARKGDGIHTVRKVLRCNKEDLNQDQLDLMTAELEYMGTNGRQIHAAWQAKELLRGLLGLAISRTHPTPDHSAMSAARHRFLSHVADHAHLPELLTLAETVEQRWDGIEAYLITGIANAASEGNNRFIKLEARNAYRNISSVSSKHSLTQPFMQLLRREGE
ncbi:ISL3 family transposase [Streptomyces cuspidosporus]|uniref:ISL3 family transposase n=1 Tax=Streptomyces cuspidosporus TaxID=66882 RepID=UPI0031FC18C4